MKKANLTAANAAPTVETENGTETQIINDVVAEATKTDAPETKTPTPTAETEAPKKEAPKAQTFEELQKLLDTELARLNYKKRLAQQRETFINSMGSLQLYIEELATENEFETQSGKITFKVLGTDRYDHPNFIETFTISNTDIIRKFCDLLFSEMKQKKTELETQLLTA